ncbi:hypothetical protein [Mammaliicoccus sciuri]|uniref:hypothetical protein n=1 Tax=Mammaliicoccus sciuri TaxID=1296 RepID=UPI00194FF47D|nr:hypothetical protein [Mammaliicoccus sciuri]
MDKTRLVNLATDLMIKQIYSGMRCLISTRVTKYEKYSIELTHFDSRYEKGNRSLHIFEWQDDEEIMSTFEQMKDVIAGERLIENERNT